MKACMDRDKHHQHVQRALELGRTENPLNLAELIGLLRSPSAEVRRLAASAIGKRAGFGADAAAAVAALAPVASRDPHPQVKQYALKSLKAYGAAAEAHARDLDDLAANEVERDYVRRAADSAAAAIREAVKVQQQQLVHGCQRCARPVPPDEYARSHAMFQRTLCDHCFDETYIKRRNKKQMYQHAGKRLISLYPKDIPSLDALLPRKVAMFGVQVQAPTVLASVSESTPCSPEDSP